MPLPLLHSLAGNCRVGVFHAKFCISDRPGPKGASRHRFKLVGSQGVFHVNSTRQQNVFFTRKTITDLWNSMSPFYGYYFELGGIWAIKGRALRNTQLSKLGKCCSTKFSVLVFWPYTAKRKGESKFCGEKFREFHVMNLAQHNTFFLNLIFTPIVNFSSACQFFRPECMQYILG